MSRNGLDTRATSKRARQNCNTNRNGRYNGNIEGDVLRSVRQFGSEVTRTVRQRAANLRETAADCLSEGRKRARSIERSVGRRIEERPLASLCAAAGACLLVGFLAGRRR